MIIDKEIEYSDSQAETTVAAHASTNIYDSGAANSELGIGEDLRVRCEVDDTWTSGGAATLQAQFQSATDAAFTAPVTHFDSGALALAGLAAGTEIADFPLPKGVLRYTRWLYTIGTAVMTAGSVSAYMVKDTQANRAYPDAL